MLAVPARLAYAHRFCQAGLELQRLPDDVLSHRHWILLAIGERAIPQREEGSRQASGHQHLIPCKRETFEAQPHSDTVVTIGTSSLKSSNLFLRETFEMQPQSDSHYRNFT